MSAGVYECVKERELPAKREGGGRGFVLSSVVSLARGALAFRLWLIDWLMESKAWPLLDRRGYWRYCLLINFNYWPKILFLPLSTATLSAFWTDIIIAVCARRLRRCWLNTRRYCDMQLVGRLRKKMAVFSTAVGGLYLFCISNNAILITRFAIAEILTSTCESIIIFKCDYAGCAFTKTMRCTTSMWFA